MPELPNRWLQMLYTCNSILSDAVYQLYNEVDGVFTAGHGKKRQYCLRTLTAAQHVGGGGGKVEGQAIRSW